MNSLNLRQVAVTSTCKIYFTIFVSAFSAFLFLFEAISKNLPRAHINLHCLILICLEALLSTSSLQSHTDVLLYWYLSELRPITQTILKTVAYAQLPLKFIGCITSMKIILFLIACFFQDVWFLWFSMLSRTKCVSPDIPRQQQDQTQKALAFPYLPSFLKVLQIDLENQVLIFHSSS